MSTPVAKLYQLLMTHLPPESQTEDLNQTAHADVIMENACTLIKSLVRTNKRLTSLNEENDSIITHLESLRPHWAKGYTDESVAAQAATGALTELWEMLGVKNQTQAALAIESLQARTDDTVSEDD